ncbi:MAG: hypothetical protein FWC91_09885 [Defluviitaleaceae bacterium]|nr:hypothetical protein [Defluviitaleaceae bacterium]
MVYDCFLFFNEFDLLEIRLHVLSETVDKFVIVEADKSFSNNEKPYYFEDNKERYKQFLNKIIHIKIKEYPATRDAWEMERYQRNQIALGIAQCSDNDIILISDLDEIPNPEAINRYKKIGNGVYNLKQLHFDYFLNYQRCGKNNYWYNAKILKYKDFASAGYTPQNIRTTKNNKYIKKGGWHFSFCGGIQNIILKIQSFSHQEFNNVNYINDKLEYKIRMGLDLFDRSNIRLIPIKISSKKHPKYVVDNQEKYSHLIYSDINNLLALKNRIACIPYYIIRTTKQFLKMILPKSLVTKLRRKG